VAHLLTYLEAILRVYNRYGRRDNIHKARIKILVKERGIDSSARKSRPSGRTSRTARRRSPTRSSASSALHAPAYETLRNRACSRARARLRAGQAQRPRAQGAGLRRGDAVAQEDRRAAGRRDADQMDAIADLADRYSFGELRVSHEQNLILADVRQRDLQRCGARRGARPRDAQHRPAHQHHRCPGGDFCSLANAKSIPVAQAIQERFDDLDYLHDIGELDLNISGCMNACGHHHVGHIGILGVDKNGEEWYQIEIGGNQGETVLRR
jgi:sulfite reductase (NADPH) hemoprotein beta-component